MQVNNISKLETRRKIFKIKLLHSMYTNRFCVNPSKYLHSLSRRPTRSSHLRFLFLHPRSLALLLPPDYRRLEFFAPWNFPLTQIFVTLWGVMWPPARVVFELFPLFVLPCLLESCACLVYLLFLSAPMLHELASQHIMPANFFVIFLVIVINNNSNLWVFCFLPTRACVLLCGLGYNANKKK